MCFNQLPKNLTQEFKYLRSDITRLHFYYSETCLNRTALGPTFLFGIDRLNLLTFPTLKLYFKFCLHRIPVYTGFSLNRFQTYSLFNPNKVLERITSSPFFLHLLCTYFSLAMTFLWE
jgi:hypothetical protein